MATRTISITDEAYIRLANLKRANESFSRVIERLTGKVNLNNFFGVLSKETADKLEETIKETRKKQKELREVRTKKLKEAFS